MTPIEKGVSEAFTESCDVISVGKLKKSHSDVFKSVDKANWKWRAGSSTEANALMQKKKMVPLAEDEKGRVVLTKKGNVIKLIGKEKLNAILEEANGMKDSKGKRHYVEDQIAKAYRQQNGNLLNPLYSMPDPKTS